MTKVYIPNSSKQTIGGGWTFLRNFSKGLIGKGEIVNSWQDSDVVLIVGVTMTERREMLEAKAAGKKIILRVDNMPKDSRNRGTAFSRMKDFGILADKIIFQSKWAEFYVGDWLKNLKATAMLDSTRHAVIYNGVDKSIFFPTPNPETRAFIRYLFVHFNRDENKRFPEASYEFYIQNRNAVEKGLEKPELWLVGTFSPEVINYEFDFFNDEQTRYFPPIEDAKALADIYRQCDVLLFPAFADAAPNTVAEGMACGLDVACINDIGGTKEMVEHFKTNGVPTIQKMVDNYLEVINK